MEHFQLEDMVVWDKTIYPGHFPDLVRQYGNGPFKVRVSFGPTDPNNSANPSPFNMLTTHVPFMTNSMMSIYSVNSTCQWDGDSDTWNSWSAAAKGIWNTISANAGSAAGIFSGMF